MENKMIIGIVSICVSIIVLASVLIPIIDNATETETETVVVPKEGAYGPSLTYQGEPETISGTVYTYISAKINPSDNTQIVIQRGTAMAGYDSTVNLDISSLTGKTLIIYSDSNLTIYIEDNEYKCTDSDFTAQPLTSNVSVLTLRNSGSTVKYSIGSVTNVEKTKPTYYYSTTGDGDYLNFVGDNPPSMDTPSAAVAGVYIGEGYTTTTIETGGIPGGAVLLVIPLFFLVAILVVALRLVTRNN